MGVLNNFLHIIYFYLFNIGAVNGVLYQKMALFGTSFWVSVSSLFLALFGFVNRSFFRFLGEETNQKKNPDCLAADPQEKNLLESVYNQSEDESRENTGPDMIEFFEENMEDEKESSNLLFKFEFQTRTYQKFSTSYRGYDGNVGSSSGALLSANKYEFMSGEDLCCFMDKPEDLSSSIRDFYSDSENGIEEITDEGSLSDKYFPHHNSETEAVHEEKPDNSVSRYDRISSSSEEDFLGEAQFLSEKDFIAINSDLNSIASSPEFVNDLMGSVDDGFLSEEDFEEELDNVSVEEIDGEKIESSEQDLEEAYLQNLSKTEEDIEIMEQLKKLEESEISSNFNQEENGDRRNGSLDDTNKSGSEKPSGCEDEDPNRIETLWEHQDLIEQLKMELKKVRAIGLPTILEESESPKIMEDLKPWKIDEMFRHEDRMGELHKFYKSYRERMRKFDILNYQKMYAIGFLQSKDPLHSISGQKSSQYPAITSLFPNIFKGKKLEFDPMKQFIRELHGDLETVYVGQLCLSWEILHWQYEKTLEIWESDPYGIHRYNEVAGEFQQFQVLIQRFIENEPFQGPRVQNYVKTRCILRNLLQVPVIREDSTKGKRKARRRGRDDDAITSDMLVEIMEESIRIFWRFVQADKDANVATRKSRRGTQVEPQPGLADLELLANVRSALQKKEKKLKDILRSGNCILRKFQKHQEENSDQVLYFFSQVDMKLVARVLNMSSIITTDQLLWCHNKLNKISFVNGKIHVEPSFSLFPC